MSKRLAFVFPGQGSQRVGMGRAWAERFPAAREIFEHADGTLGGGLSRICWEGPEGELQLTANAQPAILTTSIAILRALEPLGLEPVAVAGHSLGEYSALVAVGSLGLEDAVRLVRRRGELMQEAVPVGEGAMAAILGLSGDEVDEIARQAAEGRTCTVANLNAPEQTVIAGHRDAVERAVEAARRRGARRALLLPVSAPFHSPLMGPVRESLAPLLAATPFGDPRTPVVSNVDAGPVSSAAQARDALIRQIDSPVRWVESVRWMVESAGVELFVEIGPGTVLAGLIRRIVPTATAVSVGEPEKLDELKDLVR